MKTGFWRGIFNRIAAPSFDQAGDGGGGGDSRGQQRGGQGGDGQHQSGGGDSRGQQRGGQEQQQQRQDGGDGQSRRGLKLSDEVIVETDDGRHISYKDYRAEQENGYKTTYDTRYKSAYDLLVKEAEKLDKLRAGGQGQRQQQQTQTQDDPFGDLDQLPIVDGKTAKQLIQTLQNTGLKPIADLVQAMQRKIQGLETNFKQVGAHVGTANEERQSQEFESTLTKTLSKIEVKGFQGALDTNEPAIREYARNLYLSYQPDSWRAGEFEKMLGEQLSAVVSYVRKADKTYADGAGERLRQNFNSRKGAGQPGGNKKFKYESPREIRQRAEEAGMFGNVGRT